MGELVEELELSGWLVRVTDEVSYRAGLYGEDYEYLGEDDYYTTEESSPLLGLENDGETLILAKELYNICEQARWAVESKKCFSAQITYHVSDNEMTWDELTENRLKQVFGAPDADYGHHCSDLTGYLWTDEKFVVNNHDLIKELWSIVGDKYVYKENDKVKKWFYLKVSFYKG